MKMQTLALVSMVTVAVGGVAWVLLYPLLSGERQAEKRRASVAGAEPMARVSRTPQKSRREQVEETLKELEVKSKSPRNLPLHMKIEQAGLSWSKNKFLMVAAALGLVGFLLVLLAGFGLLSAVAVGFAAAGPAAMDAEVSEGPPREEVSQRLSGRRGRHRARHQGRPAAARQPEDHRA